MQGAEGMIYCTIMVAVIVGFFIISAKTEWGQKWLYKDMEQ